MKKEDFYRQFANVSIDKRFQILTYDATSPICDMTLLGVYNKIKKIDDKLREDEIKREELLKSVEPFLLVETYQPHNA